MAKTYSELLVVIAQRDLALAKLKLQIERDSREFHETYMASLESHKRDLASIDIEWRETLKHSQEQIEYWQGEVVKARRERDELYKRDDNWREELKLANDRIARLKGENNELRLKVKKLTPETLERDPLLSLLDDTPETLEDSPLTGGDSPETPKGWDSV